MGNEEKSRGKARQKSDDAASKTSGAKEQAEERARKAKLKADEEDQRARETFDRDYDA
ncbi:hypothetical protein AB8O64_22465 [Streptomyces sp. QH1-20]|uniref:hypothetical protein n=1 Tax=Streptomyces sp. QH1-20 TaxID=3240934 RepID=UPI003512AD0E